jgi:hypothetical protein
MKTIHQLIGKFMLRYWLVRYRRQIQAAAGVGAVLLAAAGYLIATRQPPEG